MNNSQWPDQTGQGQSSTTEYPTQPIQQVAYPAQPVNQYQFRAGDYPPPAYLPPAYPPPAALYQPAVVVGQKPDSLRWWTWLVVGLVILAVSGVVAFQLENNSQSNPLVVPGLSVNPTASPLPASSKPTATVAVKSPVDAPATPAVRGVTGQTVEYKGYKVTVNEVERSPGYGAFNKPKEGYEFLAVNLTVESTKNKGISANPFNAKLKDTSGHLYGYNILGREPQLDSQNDIPAGQKVEGWVTFEVPANVAHSTGLILQYDRVDFIDGTLIEIQIS